MKAVFGAHGTGWGGRPGWEPAVGGAAGSFAKPTHCVPGQKKSHPYCPLVLRSGPRESSYKTGPNTQRRQLVWTGQG